MYLTLIMLHFSCKTLGQVAGNLGTRGGTIKIFFQTRSTSRQMRAELQVDLPEVHVRECLLCCVIGWMKVLVKSIAMTLSRELVSIMQRNR